MQLLKRWLSPAPSDLQELQTQLVRILARLDALERSEAAREAVVNDQLDKLGRMFKRWRQREVSDDEPKGRGSWLERSRKQ